MDNNKLKKLINKYDKSSNESKFLKLSQPDLISIPYIFYCFL
jgi:hypothetical protein